jgi:hypothetical protein
MNLIIKSDLHKYLISSFFRSVLRPNPSKLPKNHRGKKHYYFHRKFHSPHLQYLHPTNAHRVLNRFCFTGTCKVPVTWAVLGQVLVEKMFEIGENSCMGGAAIEA